jgi:antitoxin YefM
VIAVKGTDVKNNFKSLCDRVFLGETIIISRPKNENIIMISEKEFAEYEKARRNYEYLSKIDRAIAQRDAGTMKEHELIDA